MHSDAFSFEGKSEIRLALTSSFANDSDRN